MDEISNAVLINALHGMANEMIEENQIELASLLYIAACRIEDLTGENHEHH